MQDNDDVLTPWLAGWLGYIGGLITSLVTVVILLSLPGCASSHPTAAPVPLKTVASVPVRDSLAGLPQYLVPAPVGSSPRQRRQWQRAQTRNLARAGVQPTKIKNSSVATAPGATAINRPASTVVTGSGAATDARKAGQRGGAAAVGPGAVATATQAGVSWWVYLVVAVLGAVGWELLSAKVTPVRQLLKWRS